MLATNQSSLNCGTATKELDVGVGENVNGSKEKASGDKPARWRGADDVYPALQQVSQQQPFQMRWIKYSAEQDSEIW